MRTVIVVATAELVATVIAHYSDAHRGPDDDLVCAVIDTHAALEGSLPTLGPARRITSPRYAEITSRAFREAFKLSSAGTAMRMPATRVLDTLRHAGRVVFFTDPYDEGQCHALWRLETWLAGKSGIGRPEIRSTTLPYDVDGTLADLAWPSAVSLSILHNLRLRFFRNVERAAFASGLRDFPSADFAVAALSTEGPIYSTWTNDILFSAKFRDVELTTDAGLRGRMKEMGLALDDGGPRMLLSAAGDRFVRRTGLAEVARRCHFHYSVKGANPSAETARTVDLLCPARAPWAALPGLARGLVLHASRRAFHAAVASQKPMITGDYSA